MSVRKLTDKQVQEIRCLNKLRLHYKGLYEVYSIQNIANAMGVSTTTINGVIEGYSYVNVPEEGCIDDRCKECGGSGTTTSGRD